MTGMGGARSRELQSLRNELRMRILLQNMLLIVSVVLYAPFALMAAVAARSAWDGAVAYAVIVLALSLQWCHHGIRTKQIKQYLVRSDTSPDGWEQWLPANRPKTLLGARWLISTKGVFLGLSMAAALVAFSVKGPPSLLQGCIAAVLWLSTACFLMSNPKE